MELEMKDLIAQYGPWLVSGVLKVIGALLLLVIGLRIASMIANFVRSQSLKHEEVDDTLGNFFASLTRWAITLAMFIAVLGVFGVEIASFAAVLGALTLAIGLSMQGALGNIASGVMIMLFRPYGLGDFIEVAGKSGTVKDINLFQTVIATPDNIKIMVPNAEAISGVIMNYSGYQTRRCDVVFGIDYDNRHDDAIALIKTIVEADNRIHSNPEPFIRVTNLGDSSVDITCRLWCQASDYWSVKFDLLDSVKKSFDANGISIPYPHTVMVQKNS